MISAADLAMARAAVSGSGLMQTACIISRGGATVATTTCSIALQPPVTIISADRLEPEPRWRLRFPFGTDVNRGDVVIAAGERYAVVEEDDPRTYAMTTLVLALKTGAATDDPGTPGDETGDYLHANATIQLARYSYNAGTKQTSLSNVGAPFPARVDDASTTLTEEGSGPAFDVLVTCSAEIDIRDGDLIVSIVPPVSALPTVGQVLHVSVERVNDGLAFKKAQVVEHVQAGGG